LPDHLKRRGRGKRRSLIKRSVDVYQKPWLCLKEYSETSLFCETQI
jgi:hypothetical protein